MAIRTVLQNALQSVYNILQPAPVSGAQVSLQSDQSGNLLTMPGIQVKVGSVWTSTTPLNTVQYPTGTDVVGAPLGCSQVAVTFYTPAGADFGSVTFEGTFDGIHWLTITASQLLAANSSPFTLSPNPFNVNTIGAAGQGTVLVLLGGFQNIRIRLSGVISGGSAVQIYWLSGTFLSNTGVYVQGPVSADSGFAGNPVVVAGVDANGNVQELPVTDTATTAPSQALLTGGVFNLPPLAVLTPGQASQTQVDHQGTLWVNTEGRKASYRAVSIAQTIIANATAPTFSLTGSSVKTVRIRKIEISVTAATGGVADVSLVRYSALSGGTSAAITIAPLDINNSALNQASPLTWSVAATTSTVTGILASRRYEIVQAAITVLPGVISWTFGDVNEQSCVLRGASDFIGIRFSSVGTTPLADIWIEWTEGAD
jgi:hypothetical protein